MEAIRCRINFILFEECCKAGDSSSSPIAGKSVGNEDLKYHPHKFLFHTTIILHYNLHKL
jgi:hypothetical protein